MAIAANDWEEKSQTLTGQENSLGYNLVESTFGMIVKKGVGVKGKECNREGAGKQRE